MEFLSEPPQSLLDAIRALDTTEAHGDLLDDTRWYSGTSISIRYAYEPSAAHWAQFRALMSQYADHGHHFEQAVKLAMGPNGQNILDNKDWRRG